MTDVGKKIKIEVSADDQLALLGAIAASSNDAIIGKNLSGIVTYWNEAAERLFGFSASAMIGQSIKCIIPADRTGEEGSILERVGHGEKLTHFETERLTCDGKIIPVSLSISPILSSNGKIIGISDIARDLSDTQRLNSELLQRQALVSSILDTNPDGLIIIDEFGLVKFFSSAAERMFGFAAEDVIGKNVSMLMPESYSASHDSYIARYREIGERRIIGVGRVVAGRRKNGTTFPMDLTIGEAKAPGARQFTGFVRDLTEREDRDRRLTELQTELLHVARLSELGQMVSALAHEVNQPLTAMANYLSGIRRLIDDDAPPRLRQALEKVIEQSQRARSIVQSLRGMVKKEERPRRAEKLESLILETTALVLIGVNRAVKFELKIGADADVAFVDRVQIQQVLVNLMRNAVEAMETSETRVLVVSTERISEHVEISVSDTGPGLADLVQAKLFQPFVTTKLDGLGVGLSICRTIVEGHGGELRAKSLPGQGTAFYFTLPHSATYTSA